MESNSVTIDDIEVIQAPWFLTTSQAILFLLKEKGAPIDGTIWLKRRDGYSWVCERFNDSTMYAWAKQ